MVASLFIIPWASLATYYIGKVASTTSKLGSQIPPAPVGGPPCPPSIGDGGGMDLDGPAIAIIIEATPITIPYASMIVGVDAAASATIGGGACSTPSMTTLSRCGAHHMV